MNIAAMDTHKIVKRLESAGFNPAQAETVTDILKESRDADFSQLATKADLAAAKSELKAEIDTLRKDTKADSDLSRSELKQLELRITVKVGTMVMALGGVLIAIKYFG